MGKTIAVAMSGGVDSSAAALLLRGVSRQELVERLLKEEKTC